ncbi:MAG: hypothetical protein JXK93_07005 [Sphaerochaetaceae bacterium]|nr:hypothetical protein [Sphaerochaetaceae bacterium]
MKRIPVLALLSVLLMSLTAGSDSAPLYSQPFRGVLPYQSPSVRLDDLFNGYDGFMHQIIAASRQPYTLEWLEDFVSEEMRSTLVYLHQDLLEVMSESEIESVRVTEGQGSISAELVYRKNGREAVCIKSIWIENEDGVYRLFALEEK